MANHCSPTSLPLFCNSHSTQPHWFLYFSSNMSSMDPLHYIYPVPIILRVAMCDHAVQTNKLFPFICLQFSHSVVSSSLWPHGLQHARFPCPSPSPGVCSNSCPLSQWCHLILCHPLLLLPSFFPSIRIFSNKLALRIRWPEYRSFIISPSNEHSELISFRIDWFDLAVQGTCMSC